VNEPAASGHEKCTSGVGRHVLLHAEGPRTGARTNYIVVLVQRHGWDIIAKAGIVASVDGEEEAVGVDVNDRHVATAAALRCVVLATFRAGLAGGVL
jgi:hypothetical protein